MAFSLSDSEAEESITVDQIATRYIPMIAIANKKTCRKRVPKLTKKSEERQCNADGGRAKPSKRKSEDQQGGRPKKMKGNNGNDCAVCLRTTKAQKMGIPSGCQHKFCVACIKHWAKNSKTCPLDRIEFQYINIVDRVSGKILSKVDREGKAINRPICEVCFGPDRPNLMISCDCCSSKFHVGCLPDPDGVNAAQWACRKCTDSSVTPAPVTSDVNRFADRVLALLLYKSASRTTTSRPAIIRRVEVPSALIEEPPIFLPEDQAVEHPTPQVDILSMIMDSQAELLASTLVGPPYRPSRSPSSHASATATTSRSDDQKSSAVNPSGELTTKNLDNFERMLQRALMSHQSNDRMTREVRLKITKRGIDMFFNGPESDLKMDDVQTFVDEYIEALQTKS